MNRFPTAGLLPDAGYRIHSCGAIPDEHDRVCSGHPSTYKMKNRPDVSSHVRNTVNTRHLIPVPGLPQNPRRANSQQAAMSTDCSCVSVLPVAREHDITGSCCHSVQSELDEHRGSLRVKTHREHQRRAEHQHLQPWFTVNTISTAVSRSRPQLQLHAACGYTESDPV